MFSPAGMIHLSSGRLIEGVKKLETTFERAGNKFEKVVIPSSKGSQRRSSKCYATLASAFAGEVRNSWPREVSDLPRRAEAKVALHFS
jgi:hypothetical protein